MRLFKRKTLRQAQSNGHDEKPTLNDKAAKGIASFLLKMQNGFARFMSKRTKNISAFRMKAGLIVFFLTGSSLSIYFIVVAFVKKDQQTKMIKIDRLSVPKYYNENGEEPVEPDLLVTKQEHEEMQAFHHYMDSLQHSEGGKRVYDSIILIRPGLMDSVNMLEEIYQSQLKSKK
jgi:hypothetical protein